MSAMTRTTLYLPDASRSPDKKTPARIQVLSRNSNNQLGVVGESNYVFVHNRDQQQPSPKTACRPSSIIDDEDLPEKRENHSVDDTGAKAPLMNLAFKQNESSQLNLQTNFQESELFNGKNLFSLGDSAKHFSSDTVPEIEGLKASSKILNPKA